MVNVTISLHTFFYAMFKSFTFAFHFNGFLLLLSIFAVFDRSRRYFFRPFSFRYSNFL